MGRRHQGRLGPERDDEGRPLAVTFRAGAFGRSTSYTLPTTTREPPGPLAWKQTAGDLTSKLDGRYGFDADRRRRDRGHLQPRGRAAGPAARLHQAAGPEPDHAHRSRELKARVESSRVTAGPDRPASARRRASGSTSAGPRSWGWRWTGRARSWPRPGCPPRGCCPGAPPRPVGDDVMARPSPRWPTPRSRRSGSAAGDGVAGPVGVGAPGLVDDDGVLRFAPNLPGGRGARHPRAARRAAARAPGGGRQRRHLRRARRAGLRAPPEARPRRGGHPRDRDRRAAWSSTAGWPGARSASPARSATWWSTRPGRPCPCGNRGCWERFAVGQRARPAGPGGRPRRPPRRRRRLAGGDPEAVRAEDVTAAAAAGDPGALAVLEELGWWLALGLANLADILDPDRSSCSAAAWSTPASSCSPPTRRAFDDLVEGGPGRPEVRSSPAALGERAGAVGAALAGPRTGRALVSRPDSGDRR